MRVSREKLRSIPSKMDKQNNNNNNDKNKVLIEIFRNDLKLKKLLIEFNRQETLESLKKHLEEKILCHETNVPTYYRFRRIAWRKNETYRPNLLFKDMTQTIKETHPRHWPPKIYLEQSIDPKFGDLDDKDLPYIFLTLVFIDKTINPISLGDYWVDNRLTVLELKKLGCVKFLTNLCPENMILVEVETDFKLNILEDDKSLRECGLISGDLIHVEPLTKFHEMRPKITFTEYYMMSIEIQSIQTNEKVIGLETLKKLNSHSDGTCIICLTNQINTIIIPCGHLGLCSDCSKTLCDNKKDCPVCRRTIISTLKVFSC